MMQDGFQDSDSSEDGDNEILIIKPPQTASKIVPVLHHRNKKKRKHGKEHKSRKRHHRHHHSHSYKNSHHKSSNADSSKGIMEDKSFHNSYNKGIEYSSELKKERGDQDLIDVNAKNVMKDVTECDREISVEYQERTEVRHVKRNRRYSYKNEEENSYFLEKMKVEWRKKRVIWLQHHKNHYEEQWTQRGKYIYGKNKEREFNEQHKRIDIGYAQSEESRPSCSPKKDEKHDSIISLVSSEEEDMDYEENKKNEHFVDEGNVDHMSSQDDSGTESDFSSSHNGTASRSEDSPKAECTEENEVVSQKEMSPKSTGDKEVGFDFKMENIHAKSTEERGVNVNFEKENMHVKSTEERELNLNFVKNYMHAESGVEKKIHLDFKKENVYTKNVEETVADCQEKCMFPKPGGIHALKLPVYCPAIQGCRSIDGFQVLNRIEEGTYGVVYRAREKETKEIVALKRLKMEREKEGFPITSLREINTLLKAQHPNIVNVREIVVGSNMDRIYIVMDYVEHDLKSLMRIMPRPFLIGEVKTILIQLLCAVAHLHDNWILHRDLKTSNLLLSHQGILKVGDFGLAREYGSPLKSYTPVVVTLWYRAPELLLGTKQYSTPIDMWSVGCIFGELLTKSALFPGKSESDQITRIFKDLGTPSEEIWPGYSTLPLVQSLNITRYPYNNLKRRLSTSITDLGFDLLNRFLTYNPARRISAEEAKSHEYFNENPRPTPPNMFPTWPTKSEQEHRQRARSSPKPPVAGLHYSRQ